MIRRALLLTLPALTLLGLAPGCAQVYFAPYAPAFPARDDRPQLCKSAGDDVLLGVVRVRSPSGGPKAQELALAEAQARGADRLLLASQVDFDYWALRAREAAFPEAALPPPPEGLDPKAPQPAPGSLGSWPLWIIRCSGPWIRPEHLRELLAYPLESEDRTRRGGPVVLIPRLHGRPPLASLGLPEDAPRVLVVVRGGSLELTQEHSVHEDERLIGTSGPHHRLVTRATQRLTVQLYDPRSGQVLAARELLGVETTRIKDDPAAPGSAAACAAQRRHVEEVALRQATLEITRWVLRYLR
ncbi:MAG: hypothetical protein AB7N76_14480 [Planctomycetota bacterium]